MHRRAGKYLRQEKNPPETKVMSEEVGLSLEKLLSSRTPTLAGTGCSREEVD